MWYLYAGSPFKFQIFNTLDFPTYFKPPQFSPAFEKDGEKPKIKNNERDELDKDEKSLQFKFPLSSAQPEANSRLFHLT